ncbi:hypothetical protein BJ980_000524 [Nocardioides daedukensis]|uniref:Protein dehydratase n=1 Tax=Nocardioides daedukensis TaxID=634462 RepID=A0A7Y9RY86_9ACTN|nr:hypothetical protein [Nocardioides daedukensis]
MNHDHDWIMAQADAIKAKGPTAPRAGRDPINQPMINNWLEAMGNTNPRYSAGEAPPSMAQVWTMKGLNPTPGVFDPLHAAMGTLNEAGFTGVLGTNSSQTYRRNPRVGEEVFVTTELVSVVGPKKTGVGQGYFVTSRNNWYVNGADGEPELIADMDFRVLKFVPGPRKKPNTFVLYPTRNRDTQFFWDGTAAGELRIQKCNACGALRHPPGPTCPECLTFDRGYVVSSGRGTVFSHVVHHHPPIPGHELPIQLALVDLEEGVRMLATVDGVPTDELEIGMEVEVGFRTIDEDLTLPVWRRPGSSAQADASDATGDESPASDPKPESTLVGTPTPGQALPEWKLPITPTLVVSTALATRDFQDVHHDRVLAQSYGSQDIFINILTSNALVEKYVTDWVGPDVDIKSISIRLGAPAYPDDEFTFNGSVASVEGNRIVLDIVGSVSLGAHVTGQVTLELQEGS